MSVLSRGARVRRGGRRPGWVLLTTLLVLAIGASSALVFTNRVELLKLAVILALWAAVAGAFVSVLYRRQSDADQARVRDLKLVYDLQLDREISARREYELTVESQLRRELASELRAQAADDLAALRAELNSLRTSLEILFDTDLQHRPALETVEAPDAEAPPERAYSEWDRNGENPRGAPVDWVTSDRVTSVAADRPAPRLDETAIIDVPEVGVPPADGGSLLPPRQQPPRERVRFGHEGPQETPAYGPPPEQRFEPRHRPPPAPPAGPPPQQAPPPQPQPQTQGWQPAPATGLWLPPGAPDSNWAGGAPVDMPAESAGGRRARHSEPAEPADTPPAEPAAPPPQYGESGRRYRSRHSAEYRDYGVRNFTAAEFAPEPEPQPPAPVAAPAAAPPPPASPRTAAPLAEPPPPQMAPPPVPRHGGGEPLPDGGEDGSQIGGQSVADLLARLQVQPSDGGRRRRRDS
ncbi:DUF6779 domain-containing protein [Mycobacterium sp. 050134]|uniref:DUF6779 domain-containing protein n=1 Tax=Mycobacterium sp. 050134 TaxID=3096111 RepID=UPI002EDA9F67